VLAFLVDDTPTVSSADEQAALGDLIPFLAKASNSGSILFHFCLEA
jgi:hypothetical protein